jgi:hypothetical protein
MDLLSFLQNWYSEQCNGDWEHSYGIKIDTLDNPGWSVEIDLEDTDLGSKSFNTIRLNHSDGNWIHCRVEDSVFKGRGGPRNLEDILKVFHDWALEYTK